MSSSSTMSMISGAVNSMVGQPLSGSDNNLKDRLSQLSGTHDSDMGDIYLLRGELRTEFRGIYEAIIDSALAAMY